MADLNKLRRTQDGEHKGDWKGHDFNAPKGAHRGGRDPQIGDEYDENGDFIDPNAPKEEAEAVEADAPKKQTKADMLAWLAAISTDEEMAAAKKLKVSELAELVAEKQAVVVVD